MLAGLPAAARQDAAVPTLPLEDCRIQIITQTTTAAAATFNRLAAEGTDVAGAFHLTC